MSGSEPAAGRRAATWGGSGFRDRQQTHAEEVVAGQRWHPCGCRSEYETLREVLLSRPGAEVEVEGDPDASLFLRRPDLGRLRKQTAALAALYESLGVVVRLFRPERTPPPNLIFQRDLFFMTPEGAILARPASAQRAGEERFAAEALAGLGVPILRTLTGEALFEGADALWVDPATVWIGLGRRTSRAGLEQVAAVLAEQGVEVVAGSVPEGAQHLLGVINVIDRRLAAVDAERLAPELDARLRAGGFELIELPPDAELREGRGMNFVTVGPRRVVMPSGCSGIRGRLEAEGVEVFEADVGEYLAAGGGPGCLTGILRRG
jgi:N-dimethylarginine dimethylaminohydrolase